jgi:hypothetical protein
MVRAGQLGLARTLTTVMLLGCNAGAAATHGDAGERRLPDAAARDASVPLDAAADAATRDAAPSDAGNDAGAEPFPTTLAQTGLYARGSTTQLADGVMPYAPRYALWSDGADKQRWLLLPSGTRIDTRDMDVWQYPVGTKAWKEFSRDGKRIETRLLWKTSAGWFAMAFAWNDAETDGVAVPKGVQNARGTTHDIPNRDACAQCHEGIADRLLGVSAIQLAHDGPGVTLTSLAASGALSDPPTHDLRLPDTAEWRALGYLHANCGSCHNPEGTAADRLDLDLSLRAGSLTRANDTPGYKTTVDVALTDTESALTKRIAPGDPDQSGVILRMMLRGDDKAMPPLASETADADGLTLIRAWIQAM